MVEAAAFLALLVAVAWYRRSALTAQTSPPGVDFGNYLGFGAGWIGDGVRPSAERYPPVAPLILLGAVKVFGLTAGVGLVAAVASIAPAAGGFVLLRRWVAPPFAFLLGSALALSTSLSEPAAWGGVPQLLGLGAFGLVLVAQERFTESPSGLRGLIVGLALVLVAATSHLVLAFTASVSAVVLVAVLASGLGWRALARLIPGAAVAGILITPLYVPLVLTVGRSFLTRNEGERTPTGASLGVARFVFRDNPGFWWLALGLGIAAPIVTAGSFRSSAWRSATATAVVALPLWVVFREYRLAYFLPVAGVLSLGQLLRHVSPTLTDAAPIRWVVIAALVVIGAQQAGQGGRQLESQVRRYRLLDPSTTASLQWLARSTPKGSVVVVPACRGLPLGWWVEGVARRPTLSGSDPRWLNFASERTRASQAEAILAPPFPAQLGPAQMAPTQGRDVYALISRQCSSGLFRRSIDGPLATGVEPVRQDEGSIVLRLAS